MRTSADSNFAPRNRSDQNARCTPPPPDFCFLVPGAFLLHGRLRAFLCSCLDTNFLTGFPNLWCKARCLPNKKRALTSCNPAPTVSLDNTILRIWAFKHSTSHISNLMQTPAAIKTALHKELNNNFTVLKWSRNFLVNSSRTHFGISSKRWANAAAWGWSMRSQSIYGRWRVC